MDEVLQKVLAQMLLDIDKLPIEISPPMSIEFPPDIFIGYNYYEGLGDDFYIPRSFYDIENGPSLWEILKACYLANPEKLMAINLSMEVIARRTKKRYCLNVCRIRHVDSIYRHLNYLDSGILDSVIPDFAGIFDFFVNIECNGEISNAMFQYNLDTRTGSFSSSCDPLKFMQAVS